MKAPTLSTRDRWRSWFWLLLCLTLLVAGACMDLAEGQARLAGIQGPSCLVGDVLGERYCPGCGLTRATSLAIQGDLPRSFAIHPAGFPVVLFSLGAILVHGHILWRGRRGRGHNRITNLGYRSLALLLLLAWVFRML